ncbi:MAG: cache domain-containing protein [Candidatus Eisenbacteria bacterium]
MSIRSALIGGLAAVVLLSSGVLTFVGIRSIRDRVVEEAQSRVSRNLALCSHLLEADLELAAERLEIEVERSGLPRMLAEEVSSPDVVRTLADAKRALSFPILGIVDPNGNRLDRNLPEAGGASAELPPPVPGGEVLRAAYLGSVGTGTIRLSAAEIREEGGEALLAGLRIRRDGPGSGVGELERSSRADGAGAPESSALFQWCALPISGEDGTVRAVVYGGRPLNYAADLVDRLASSLFGGERYDGKPVGTVTFFLGDLRVATNVRDADGERAIGTRVSPVVRTAVLEGGETWHDRAWVVDAWYLSGYEPLRDPSGTIVGMLYVGLLEAPYDAIQKRAVLRFVLPALGLFAFSLLGTVLVVERITRPLERLKSVADRVADGDWKANAEIGRSYAEIDSLSEALSNMQAAIARRDREVREKNAELSDTNDRLEEANQNYMNTLGFVTHELKAPLANIQALIDLVLDVHGDGLKNDGRALLVRVQRNCEELQGMVKDYLDLSRAERGGFAPSLRPCDLLADVIEPAIALSEGILLSRTMRLAREVSSGKDLEVFGDPELLRIALGNLLGNAAKYGREGGNVRLGASGSDTGVDIEVWNEGDGFTEEEGSLLFTKFTRLRNANTKTKKGSGLGLYLASEIARAHGGEIRADSEPGAWARFVLRIPARPGDARRPAPPTDTCP